jgi:hypothetical protein
MFNWAHSLSWKWFIGDWLGLGMEFMCTLRRLGWMKSIPGCLCPRDPHSHTSYSTPPLSHVASLCLTNISWFPMAPSHLTTLADRTCSFPVLYLEHLHQGLYLFLISESSTPCVVPGFITITGCIEQYWWHGASSPGQDSLEEIQTHFSLLLSQLQSLLAHRLLIQPKHQPLESHKQVRKHHQKKKSSTVGESTNRGQDGVKQGVSVHRESWLYFTGSHRKSGRRTGLSSALLCC